MEKALSSAFLIVLVIAAICDLKYRKIPNLLTLSVIAAGLIYHSWFSGIHGFLLSLGGTFLGIGLLIVFYVIGKMGAGDVKLMGAVGSVLGPAGVFNAFLFTAIVGGFYAIIILLIRGGFAESMRRLFHSLGLSIMALDPVTKDEKKIRPVLCYGIAIAIGTSLSMVFDICGFPPPRG